MADQLRGGSTAGGYPIITSKEVPMIFRVDSGKLQYSQDGGITWLDAEFTGDATATAAQILSGVTAYVGGNKITGSMANRGNVTSTLTTNGAAYTIPVGYHAGAGKVTASITNLTAANIKTGVAVGGVTGTYKGVGTAGTAQVLAGYTFSSSSLSGASGTMVNRGAPTWNPSASVQSLASGYYSGGTINPSIKFATGTHAGSSGTTLTKTVGWKPRFVMIKGTRGMWFLSGDAFTSIVTTYDSAGAVTGSTVYNHYGMYINPTSSGTAYNYTTNSITTTGFSIALPSGSTGYSYTWWAYAY